MFISNVFCDNHSYIFMLTNCHAVMLYSRHDCKVQKHRSILAHSTVSNKYYQKKELEHFMLESFLVWEELSLGKE